MIPVDSGERLLGLAHELDARGAKGFLLSGGCDHEGKVPLQGFLDAVAKIKAQTALTINVHTGLLDRLEEARALASSGADCLSVDVVQDPETITGKMHLNRGPEDYIRTLELLFSAGAVRVVPHVCIGLSGESTDGELAALRSISRFPVGAVVLLSFLPARNTPLAAEDRPSPEHVLEVAGAAVSIVDAPVIMGCMRARGDWRLEVDLLCSGVEALAMPSSHTVRWAERTGVKIEWREECCALQR
jgi:uncharacterized radical SAM superfamily protein